MKRLFEANKISYLAEAEKEDKPGHDTYHSIPWGDRVQMEKGERREETDEKAANICFTILSISLSFYHRGCIVYEIFPRYRVARKDEGQRVNCSGNPTFGPRTSHDLASGCRVAFFRVIVSDASRPCFSSLREILVFSLENSPGLSLHCSF